MGTVADAEAGAGAVSGCSVVHAFAAVGVEVSDVEDQPVLSVRGQRLTKAPAHDDIALSVGSTGLGSHGTGGARPFGGAVLLGHVVIAARVIAWKWAGGRCWCRWEALG